MRQAPALMWVSVVSMLCRWGVTEKLGLDEFWVDITAVGATNTQVCICLFTLLALAMHPPCGPLLHQFHSLCISTRKGAVLCKLHWPAHVTNLVCAHVIAS